MSRHLLARIRRGTTPVRFTRLAVLDDVPAVAGFDPDRLFKIDEGEEGRFPVLSMPDHEPAAGLDLDPAELVLGVAVAGEARAYPLSLLRTHHVVNDRIADRPLLIAFCPRCMSGAAFDPMVDHRQMTFRVYGLYQGTAAITDDQTGTIWTPFTGEALAGPLAGRRLHEQRCAVSTLESWLAAHPSSTAPANHVGPRRPNGRRPGESANDRVLPRLVGRWDERLEPRRVVLGVVAGGAARAYPLEREWARPLAFADDLGGVPLVLMAAPGEWPLAYDRRLPGGLAEFRVRDGAVVDESGTAWRDGEALSGPRIGASLRFVSSHVAEWYAWAAFFPDTDIGLIASDRSPGARDERPAAV